jgi:predicted  nucleic acid-binding Zn-ribbon protein
MFDFLQVEQSEHDNYKVEKEVEIEQLMAALSIAEEATRAAQDELAAIKDELAKKKDELAKEKKKWRCAILWTVHVVAHISISYS